MKSLAAALTLTALLAGCSYSPRMVTASDLDKMQIGTSSEVEIISRLGKPLSSVVNADGTRMAQYPYDPTSASPYLPAFIGGETPTAYGWVNLSYDSKGTLTGITGSNSSAGVPAR